MAKHLARQQKEVLQPPAVLAYSNKCAEAHHLQQTANSQVCMIPAMQSTWLLRMQFVVSGMVLGVLEQFRSAV
jgi:hypothetical protein